MNPLKKWPLHSYKDTQCGKWLKKKYQTTDRHCEPVVVFQDTAAHLWMDCKRVAWSSQEKGQWNPAMDYPEEVKVGNESLARMSCKNKKMWWQDAHWNILYQSVAVYASTTALVIWQQEILNLTNDMALVSETISFRYRYISEFPASCVSTGAYFLCILTQCFSYSLFLLLLL